MSPLLSNSSLSNPSWALQLVALVSLLSLSACGGSSGGGNDQSEPSGASDTQAPTLTLSLASGEAISETISKTIGSASNKRPSITATFSKAVNNVNTTNVVLKRSGTVEKVTISAVDDTNTRYTIAPKADLTASADYRLEFKSGIKDTAGKALVSITYRYTTADWASPTIRSISPSDGSTLGSAGNKRPRISVTFSEVVKNVNTTNLVLTQGGNQVASTISGSGNSYTLTPNDALVANTNYTLTFKNGITDAAGNALSEQSVRYTSGETDVPTVSITPNNGASHVSVKPTISLSFSENVTGVNSTNVLLSASRDGSNPIASTLAGTSSPYTLTPNANLAYNTEYFVVLKAANIKNSNNKALGNSNQVVSFTTYPQTLTFNAWVGSSNTLIDLNQPLPSGSELYSYRGANYGACDISDITACTNGQSLLLNGQTITNTAHTLANTAFYKLKDGSLVSTNSGENTTRFSTRYNHQVVVFKNKLWLIGGYVTSNDVWSSSDGVRWTQVLANTGNVPRPSQFPVRSSHQVVVANLDGRDKLWVIGGRSYSGDNTNDVWSSEDGKNWTQVLAHTDTPNANQFSAREDHQVVVANLDGRDKLWLIGGDDGSRKNDVWSSEDGKNWTQSTINGTHFTAREDHQVVVANLDGRDKLWLIGGFDNSNGRKNDVWSSEDGSRWTQKTTIGPHFSARDDHQVVVANLDGTNKLWLMGGRDGSLTNDVWSSTDGSSWTQSTINSTHFSPRYAHQVVVANLDGRDKLWLIGGDDRDDNKNDVWRSEDGATWRKGYLGTITRPAPATP